MARKQKRYKTNEKGGGRPPHMNTRKNLRCEAEKKHRRETGWRGGILYFLDDGGRVPDVQEVQKLGRQPIGWLGSGAQVLPKKPDRPLVSNQPRRSRAGVSYSNTGSEPQRQESFRLFL